MKNTESPLVVVVSHSHWDREWYFSFEVFRHRLVRMVDGLMDLLEKKEDYRHFMMDGQTLLLEDIVELRPELEERLSGHIRSGRLSVGPWYVLQDEFLVSGESIARNMLIGQQVARRFGEPMNVGYIPDAFGHVSQIPRIFQGFGIEDAVLWRGVGDRAKHNEWRWRSPGGAEVLTLWLRWNYSTAERLSEDPDVVHEKLRGDLDRMMSESPAKLLLWMNGTDHQWPQAHIPELITELRAREPGVEIIHGKLQDAVAGARERLDISALETIEGELRRTGPGVGFLLPGVLSARSWQQRDHDEAEWLLSRVAEPFAVFANTESRGSLRYAWKTLLKCQPHDSICGCSVDEVHQELDTRISQVSQISNAINEEAIRAMAQAPTAADNGDPLGPDFSALVLANPHPYSATAMSEFTFNWSAAKMPFRLVGPTGEVQYDILEDTMRDPTLRMGDPARDDQRRLKLGILSVGLPPHGLRALRMEPGAPQRNSATLKVDTEAQTIQNGLVAVHATSGGMIFEDLSSGERVRHFFSDEADCGDEYNFSPVQGDQLLDSTEAEMSVETHPGRGSATLVVRGKWALPEGLSEDRRKRVGEGGVEWDLEARLLPGVRGVQLRIRIHNESRDHRFRARFGLEGNPAGFITDGPFDWIPRDAGDPAPVPTSQELPVPTHPMNTVAAVPLEKVAFGLGGVGLREVEFGEGGALSLTLLRSVGWLSRSDLPNRNREAGPNLPTPGAQGLGSHDFAYAVAFQDPHARVSEIHRKLEPMLFAPRVVTVTEPSIEELPLMAVEPPCVRLAAVKRAENDGRLLVRLVGADSGEPVEAMIKIYGRIRKAWLSDLDEREGTKLSPVRQGNDTMVMVRVPARDVITLALQD